MIDLKQWDEALKERAREAASDELREYFDGLEFCDECHMPRNPESGFWWHAEGCSKVPA